MEQIKFRISHLLAEASQRLADNEFSKEELTELLLEVRQLEAEVIEKRVMVKNIVTEKIIEPLPPIAEPEEVHVEIPEEIQAPLEKPEEDNSELEVITDDLNADEAASDDTREAKEHPSDTEEIEPLSNQLKEIPIPEPVPAPKINKLREEIENLGLKNEPSLNEQLADQSQPDSLADRLQMQPVRDLTKAINLNERFLFTNELFKGDGAAFRRILEELNHLESLAEAERFIQHESERQFGWDIESNVFQDFHMYVKRRFM